MTDCKYAHDVNEQQRQMALGGAGGAAAGGAGGYGAGSSGYGAQPSYGGYGQTDGNGVYAAQGEQTYPPSSPSRAPGLDGDEGGHAPLANAGSSRKRGRDDAEPESADRETTSAAEDAAAAFGGEAGDERPSKQHKAGGGEEEAEREGGADAEDGANKPAETSALLDGVTRGADGKELGSDSTIGGIEGGPDVATAASVAGESGGQIDAGAADVSTAPGDAAGPSGAPGF